MIRQSANRPHHIPPGPFLGPPSACSALIDGADALPGPPPATSACVPRLGRRPARPLSIAFGLFALFPLLSSAAPAKPKTAADIEWPKPSQPPGRVMFHPRYPIETAWDPALDAFRKTTGADFARMLEAARKNAPGSVPGSADGHVGTGRRSRRLPLRRRTFRTASSFFGIPVAGRRTEKTALIRAVDIVRIPVLPRKHLRPVLARLRRQLRVLDDQGWPLAVWEIRKLPEPDDMNAWAGACFKAFRRPPILMLGWHLKAGRIRPRPDRMKKFLEHWAAKAHSIIITGEELNTQFYAPEDGGKALDFLDYWIGVIRSAQPETFVWCRIDEVLKRRNNRNRTWLEHFLPLTDGVNYQVAFGLGDVRFKKISVQFQRLWTAKQEFEKKRRLPRAPVLLGGFTWGCPLPGRRPKHEYRQKIQQMTREAGAAVRRFDLDGCIRYVGMLPYQPNPVLFGTPRTRDPSLTAAGLAPRTEKTGVHKDENSRGPGR